MYKGATVQVCYSMLLAAGLFAGAAERLRLAKSEVRARLQRDSGSTGPPSTPPSPALLSKGSGSLLGSSLTSQVTSTTHICMMNIVQLL